MHTTYNLFFREVQTHSLNLHNDRRFLNSLNDTCATLPIHKSFQMLNLLTNVTHLIAKVHLGCGDVRVNEKVVRLGFALKHFTMCYLKKSLRHTVSYQSWPLL